MASTNTNLQVRHRGPSGPLREREPPGRAAAPLALALAEEGGAARTRPGRRGASPGGRPWQLLLSFAVCGTLDLLGILENKTMRFGPSWADLSNQEDLQSLYPEERKSVIYLLIIFFLESTTLDQFRIRFPFSVSYADKQRRPGIP